MNLQDLSFFLPDAACLIKRKNYPWENSNYPREKKFFLRDNFQHPADRRHNLSRTKI